MRKYILWDNDGVLVDTEKLFFLATRRAFKEIGIDLPKSRILQSMIDGKSCWDDIPSHTRERFNVTEKREARDQYYQDSLSNRDLEIPGVIETLDTLSRSCQMAIVTSSKKRHFDAIHERGKLLQYMSFSLTREDYIEGKPHPEPYLLALERFGIGPEEAIAVEDSQRGLASAKAAGIECIVVKNAFNEGHDFTGASHVLDSITLLPDLLEIR